MKAMSAHNAASQQAGGYPAPTTGVCVCFVTVPNDETADTIAGMNRASLFCLSPQILMPAKKTESSAHGRGNSCFVQHACNEECCKSARRTPAVSWHEFINKFALSELSKPQAFHSRNNSQPATYSCVYECHFPSQ